MPEKIPPHKHCKECGKAIPIDATFCSSQCETQHRMKLRRRRNQLYTYYLMMILLLIVILVYLGYFR